MNAYMAHRDKNIHFFHHFVHFVFTLSLNRFACYLSGSRCVHGQVHGGEAPSPETMTRDYVTANTLHDISCAF